MRKLFVVGVVLCLCCSVFFGCEKKAGSASEAIDSAQSLKTVSEKADYLIKQAEAFYNSKEFQQAIQVAQYVLNNLDKESKPAQSLIEKAKAELQAAAQKAVGDAANKFLGK
ncbi:MAG TPA: hypothetical protein PLO93_06445 [Candidatus Omnitrophota bacterium]|nr:hypothetical protein [Candidatus Omnitrophota bacterium]HQL41912.1 hypothetical protein [Candidatus Omnitrophota bacterium]